jgi:hypothetical protein
MRSPVGAPATQEFVAHDAAARFCVFEKTGNRAGWRLPTIQELSRLLDYADNASGDLPVGHPFLLVENNSFWSKTAEEGLDDDFYFVSFPGGISHTNGFNAQQLLCVQSGAPGADAQ